MVPIVAASAFDLKPKNHTLKPMAPPRIAPTAINRSSGMDALSLIVLFVNIPEIPMIAAQTQKKMTHRVIVKPAPALTPHPIKNKKIPRVTSARLDISVTVVKAAMTRYLNLSPL